MTTTDPVEALTLLARAEMKPFTRDDWFAWSGCESRVPMIGTVNDITVVLDGNTLCILHQDDEFGGTLFILRVA